MRVLIVEDDDDIATIVEQVLRGAGYSTDRAADGRDGLWMAREGRYGLIVLDLLLPHVNGFVVCETLREEGAAMPILMLTAKVGDYDEVEGLDAGADDFLRKPFSAEVLLSRIRALLRRFDNASGSVSSVLERGDVEFDHRTRRCTFVGQPVGLTLRQSQVLEALLRSGDVPLSRADLVREVWGMEFEGDPNVADVYIGYLRAKLGKATIETVRGVGFRLAA